MWIEVSNKNLMVNLDTGVRIELMQPCGYCPLHSLTISGITLAYFKDKKNALAAFDDLRTVVKPSVMLYLVGSVEAPDPFKMLGMRSPFVTKDEAEKVGLVGEQDWISKAKDLGVEPEKGR
jgi:hypothetical protein